MRTRDEHKATAIREQAIRMIVATGFDGLSMQKLAKAAGVSPATIYIYYKNREDLLRELYKHVQRTFSEFTLRGFDASMPFAEGLWRQWENRLAFVEQHPHYYCFFEQFRNSPLVRNSELELADFKENMKGFVTQAMQRGDIRRMEPELFWALAYGSFYALVKFHLNNFPMMGRTFRLGKDTLREAFEQVLKSFQ